MQSLYEFNGYRAYLREQFPGRGTARGRRKVLADMLGCQPSFISLVITERAHMSEEMLLSTADYLKLAHFEVEFLLLLYHFERAGSQKLQNHYAKKIDLLKNERSRVEEALAAKTEFSLETQIQYYSSWQYAAVHIACTLKTDVTVEYIAQLLTLSEVEVKKVLDFLIDSGLVVREDFGYVSTKKRIHLSRESHLSLASHISWRSESIRQIQKKTDKNMHFSSVYSLSERDYNRIKKLLEEQILACEKIIDPSKEERLCALNLDFYMYD